MFKEGKFFFDPNDKIYNEHFPGNPVVPGTLIIDAFVRVICEKNLLVENFTFRNFLKPGVCSYTIETVSEGFRCRVFDDEKTFAKGLILKG